MLKKEPVTVGWVGSSAGGLLYLESIRSVFSIIKRKYGNKVILKVICDKPFKFDSGGIVYKKWELKTEVESLYDFDIGIMPLIDTERARGKSGFKLIQYMGIGIPVVASPVGINKEIVKDRENGFLVNSANEWVDRISTLIDNFELRKKMGLAGRVRVEKNYSLQINYKKLKDVLNSLKK